jgi:hypothetical protein
MFVASGAKAELRNPPIFKSVYRSEVRAHAIQARRIEPQKAQKNTKTAACTFCVLLCLLWFMFVASGAKADLENPPIFKSAILVGNFPLALTSLQMNKFYLSLFALFLFCQNLEAQVDTVPPVLVCKQWPALMLGPMCYLTLQASDFVDTVYDNSQYYQLSVRKKCTGTGFPEQNWILFDASEGYGIVEVWARDSSGNTTVSDLSFFIYDGSGFCDPGSSIRYRTRKQQDLDSVVTTVNGSNCMADTIDYRIPSNMGLGVGWWASPPGNWMVYGALVPSAGYTYEIIPARNNDPLNGVTTYDLTLISKHILGTETLDSPYKIIAADVNQDGKVTTFDLLLLRKLILGTLDKLPHGKSWRFIPSDFVFPNPLNPFESPFPEKVTVPNTSEYTSGSYYFWGIKIGDLNLSADPD